MYNIMSQLSLREILKAQRNSKNEYFMQKVRREIYKSQQKMSRKVYNLESRDIKKFIREQRTYQQKINGKDPSRQPASPSSINKYDENKLLQLSFAHVFTPKTPPKAQDDVSARTIRNSSRDASSTRNVTFKNSLNKRYSFRVNQVERSKSPVRGLSPRQKSNSLPNEKLFIRKRVATQWDLSPVKQSQSRMSLQRGQTSSTAIQYHASDQFIIDVTRDKMDRFICNMHRLQWASVFLKKTQIRRAEESKDFYAHMKRFEMDPDCPIDEQAINFMISRRYHLHTNYLEDIYEQRDRFLTQQSTSNERKKLADHVQYPLLSALANHSVLRLLQKHTGPPKIFKNTQYAPESNNSSEVYFALPYSQFISYKETKNSIYQLVGMNARLGLKLVFSIFDKNRNGLVDEDDLLQLISLSRTMPTLEIDIAPLSKAMLTLKEKRSLQRSKIGRLDSKGQSRLRETRQRNLTKMSKESEPSIISPIEERDSDSESQLNQKSLSISRFSIDKLYTFLRSKEKGGKEVSGASRQTKVQPLNFLMFCKAFDFRRPYLLYDLFQFVLGASVGDFKEHIQTEINGYLNKLQSNHSQAGITEEEETLEEKWNKRLKSSNAILESFLRQKQ